MEKPAVPGPSSGDVWRVPLAVWRARRALDRGELERARELVSPLLGRFGSITFIRKLAAEILYASGDPLSAAMLFEQAAKKMVAEGLGVALLPRMALAAELRARTLRPVGLIGAPSVRRPIVAIRRRDAGPAIGPVAEFLGLLHRARGARA